MTPTHALLLAILAVGADTYIVAGVLPAISEGLVEPVSSVGLLASAYALPTALLAPVFGPFSDHRGRRAAILLGLGIFVAAAAACAIAPSLPALLVARVVNGLGAAIIIPAAFAYAGDIPDPVVRARTMGALAGAFPLATLVGLPLGAAATAAAGWRAAFVVIALVALVAAVLVQRLCPPDVPATGGRLGYLSSYRAVLSDRRALLMLSVTFAWFVGPLGLFPYMGEFVHVTFGVPTATAGLVYLIVGVVGVAAARLSGRFIATFGPRRAVLMGISAFALAAALLPLTTASLPLAIADFALWAFGSWFGVPALQSIVAGLSDTVRGTLLAFNSSALNLAGVVGPAITGQVIAVGGFAVAGPWSALLGVAALALALCVVPRPRPILPG